MLIHLSKITSRFHTKLVGLIEDSPICKTSVLRAYYSMVKQYIWSYIGEYQQYSVLRSLKKRKDMTYSQDLEIHRAVYKLYFTPYY